MRTERIEGEEGGWSLYFVEDDGREILVEDYDSEGNLTMFIHRVYNGDGEETEWTVHDRGGKLIERFVVQFSEDGTATEHHQFDGEGNLEEVLPADA